MEKRFAIFTLCALAWCGIIGCSRAQAQGVNCYSLMWEAFVDKYEQQYQCDLQAIGEDGTAFMECTLGGTTPRHVEVEETSEEGGEHTVWIESLANPGYLDEW